MAASADVKSIIHYYAQVGYYQHIQTVCEEIIRKRGNDPVLVFWKAFGAAMEGSYPEAIRELEVITRKRDVGVAVKLALIHYHKQSAMVDQEAVNQLEADLDAAEARAGEVGLLLASRFCWHIGNTAKARKLCQKIMDQAPDNPRANTLRGWIDLTVERKSRRDIDAFNKSVLYFENALSASSKPELEAEMGVARYATIGKDFPKAIDSLTRVTVHYPWFLPGLAEKAMVLMQAGQWEAAVEAADKVLSQDAYDIVPLCTIVMNNLVHESLPKEAAAKLSELIDSLDRMEPKNPDLFFRFSQPFARLAGGHPQVLNLTLTLVQRARTINPMSSEYAAEAGYQQRLLGDYNRAVDSFKEAARLDEGNMNAIQGMIHCQLLQGNVEDAEAQLEFLSMVQQSVGRTAALAFLDQLLAAAKGRSGDKQMKILKECVALHWGEVEERSKAVQDVFQHYTVMNPQFLLDVAKQHMRHCGAEPATAAAPPSAHLVEGTKMLSFLVEQVPGMQEAQLLLARSQYLQRDFSNATRTLNTCLRMDGSSSEVHLLLAQIALYQDDIRRADQSLQRALSYDFEVRSSPLFHIVKARVLELQGQFEEAIALLEKGMKLPGVKVAIRASATGAGAGAGAGGGRGGPPAPTPVSLHDRATIWMKLAELHTKLEHIPEATKLVTDAMHEFAGTSEEVRVVIANSEIAMKRGDVDAAIHMLGNIPPDSSAYTKAQMVKADIMLKHRNDQRMFARCYKDLAKRNPGERSQILLGDAYLKIMQPEDAIAAFEEALKLNPSNSALASKIGKALVLTHDYDRAVAYYEAALSHSPDDTKLRSDLTELFCKLRRFDEAHRLLGVALASDAAQDIVTLVATVKNLVLLAKVHGGTGNAPEAIKALQQSAKVQNDVMSHLRGVSTDEVREQRKVAADISYNMAKHYMTLGEDHKAKMYFSQALKAQNSHVQSMLALARLFLKKGDLEACQNQCLTLKRVDPSNEEATLMLADLMFRKNQDGDAMYHFGALLEQQPRHYTALSKLITLLKRAGKLEDAQRFVKQAERSSARAVHDPGYRFCKALYARYSNDPHEAIKLFNMVRHSGEWGEAAAEHMVEIYLGPESDMWAESEEKDASMQESVKVAEKLLREIPTRPLTPKQQVLECYTLIATKVKGNIDSAQQRLAEILRKDRDDVPALLCLATALMVQKQTPKARNQLKRIAKMKFQQNFADEFVRAWLMLADIFITSGKYDLAQELCKRCLGFDKSCARAWEHMGHIMEKEHSYIDAAEHYQNAWHFQHEASATVGYKLAFNYLKAKKYVDAINVCHKVLKQFPDYPRMRKDILDKARANLRP